MTGVKTAPKGGRAPRAKTARIYGRIGAVLLASASLGGCEVGPDYKTPHAPLASGILPAGTVRSTVSGQRFESGADISGQWWETFHSKPLSALVERAIAQNADLQAAQAALRAARENGNAQRGVLYPQVQSSFNPVGGKVGDAVASPLASNDPYYSLNTTQLSISYTPDVFGLYRRQIESADATTRAQRFQTEATYLTLTSNVVLAAIQEAGLRGQIDATNKIIEAESKLLDVLRKQKSLGQVANADVLLQEAALAQVQQSLPPLTKQLGIQRDALTALAGQYADDQVTERFDLGSLHLPRALPVSLPSTLVEHRPDVRAAEANLQSASALVGVAVANRLPLLSLSAEIGTSPANLARLFAPPTLFYTLGGNVVQTVFDGGTLLHKQKQAQAEYDQSYAQYRSTVIVAFQNVADALRAIEADERAEKAAAKSKLASEKSLAVARAQLQLGAVSTIVVLSAQQTSLQGTLSLVQAQAARLSDTVALFQALGGGWWNRNDIPPAQRYSLVDSIR